MAQDKPITRRRRQQLVARAIEKAEYFINTNRNYGIDVCLPWRDVTIDNVKIYIPKEHLPYVRLYDKYAEPGMRWVYVVVFDEAASS